MQCRNENACCEGNECLRIIWKRNELKVWMNCTKKNEHMKNIKKKNNKVEKWKRDGRVKNEYWVHYDAQEPDFIQVANDSNPVQNTHK